MGVRFSPKGLKSRKVTVRPSGGGKATFPLNKIPSSERAQAKRESGFVKAKHKSELQKKPAPKTAKKLANNFAQQDLDDVEYAKKLSRHYHYLYSETGQPVLLPSLYSSLTKFKASLLEEIPEIHERSRKTPDEAIKWFLEHNKHNVDVGVFTNVYDKFKSEFFTNDQFFFGLIKEIWAPKKE